METFRMHVVALPHTVTSREYMPCAYTQKVRNFCVMMHSLGHTVYHYGGERSEIDKHCTEHITIVTEEQRQRWWGSNDWRSGQFFDIQWDSRLPYWQTANQNAIREITRRIQSKDFICLIGGNCQKPIADAFPENMSVEFGIGYHGVFSKFRVFESYAWMHYIYGRLNSDGYFYDTVIPNYYDPEDFAFSPQKDDYLLFIGRFIRSKNVQMAAEISNRLQIPLLIAGQGVVQASNHLVEGIDVSIRGDNLSYVGVVDGAQRGVLMSKALAVICPTMYVGPFEGVSVESLFCGTPIITTDWGAFAENNIDGCTGFRVRSIGEALWAIKNLNTLWPPKQLRRYAIENFSIWNIRWKYQDYFTHLYTLWDRGWYTETYTPYRRLRNTYVCKEFLI